MKWFCLIVGGALGLFTFNHAMAEAPKEQPETVTIPLDEIWAWDMPGTRDVRSLEPELFGAARNATSVEQLQRSERSLISHTLQPLAAPAVKQQAKSAFAVLGTGLDALKNAHAVLADNQQATKSFTRDDNVSVVFFSRMFGAYVHLQEVRRRGNHVEIRYRFVPHFEAQQTVNFALIPLGKLPPGKLSVDVIRLPIDKKFVALGIAPISQELESRIVCKSSQFVVEDTPRKDN